jgi:hypothetical protein
MKIDTQQAAIDILESTPEVLRALVSRLPGELLETPADEDWSPRDVVAHFLLTQRLGALDRIRSMVEQDHPLLMNRDENEELRRSGYDARTVEDLLLEFTERRAASIALLRSLDAPALARGGEHSAVGEVTVEEMLHHAAYHDTLHLAQLTRMLGAYFEPLRGVMRAF